MYIQCVYRRTSLSLIPYTLCVQLSGTNITSQESKLYQTVYVHKLNHTDIRQVHHSLVDRKNCLGIHCISCVFRSEIPALVVC